MARFLCVAAILLFAGCSTVEQASQHVGNIPVKPVASEFADIPVKPTPSEFTELVQRAELLGRAIYRKDILAAKATDALMARGVNARVGGWVTLPDGDKWVVYFFDKSQRVPAILKEVIFPDSSAMSPEVRDPGSRPALENEAVAMFKARERARKARFGTCSRNYNSVVLPAELAGEKGWYVYLLAATKKQGVAVMGGHVRVHVSADGEEILNVKEFTRSCINMQIEKNVVALMVTHIVDNHPVETHVFMSLLYGMPFSVATSTHMWVVQKGSIGLLDR